MKDNPLSPANYDLFPGLHNGRKGVSTTAVRSPWVNSLKMEYENQGLHRWNNEKVFEICRMFGCTVQELCAWAGVFRSDRVVNILRRNRWPIYLTLQWDRLRRYKLALDGVTSQDSMAAKGFCWTNPANEEEKAA